MNSVRRTRFAEFFYKAAPGAGRSGIARGNMTTPPQCEM
jgi:hypothetical protein